MPRTALPTTNLPGAAALADPAGTAIDQPNGMVVALASGAVPHAPGAGRLVLRIANSAAAPYTVTVRAGATPPAFRAGLGDLTVSVPAGATRWFGPFESARFVQADGSLYLDFAAGITGTATAFLVPLA